MLSVSDYICSATGNEHFKAPEILKKLVDAGNIGATSGAGWYEWDIEPRQLTLERDRQLGDLLKWLRANDPAAKLLALPARTPWSAAAVNWITPNPVRCTLRIPNLISADLRPGT
jgi:3-hydroxyacyl-CoA dehydrogenase